VERFSFYVIAERNTCSTHLNTVLQLANAQHPSVIVAVNEHEQMSQSHRCASFISGGCYLGGAITWVCLSNPVA